MKQLFTSRKNSVLIFFAVLFLLISIVMVKNAVAGKPQISLNSPASFPIDI